jgi:hypothetical protein
MGACPSIGIGEFPCQVIWHFGFFGQAKSETNPNQTLSLGFTEKRQGKIRATIRKVG